MISSVSAIRALGEGLADRSAIGVGSVDHSNDDETSSWIVDAVDDAVRASTGAVPIVEWWSEPFAHTVRIVEQRADVELVGREGD